MNMFYIGIDDTDTLETRGTGRLARMLAAHLEPLLAPLGAQFVGVTRHQLLRDPRVPCTKNNSSATLHWQAVGDVPLESVAAQAAAYLRQEFVPGSDPGLCVAAVVPAEISQFGQRVQRELVPQADARALARRHGITLLGLGGTEDGVIGALASVGLAAMGSDGRYTHVGGNRTLDGAVTVEAILAAGIVAVLELDGTPVISGLIWTDGRVRPARRNGQPILYVARREDGWQPLKLD